MKLARRDAADDRHSSPASERSERRPVPGISGRGVPGLVVANPPPAPAAPRLPSARSQSPQIRLPSGFAQALKPQPGQVYFVLLAAFFLRVAASPFARPVMVEDRPDAWPGRRCRLYRSGRPPR